MGTSSTALQAGSGRFGFALLVEGFDRVITDSADLAAVVTAYAGTGWTQAISGLKVIGAIKQSIEPFKHDLDVPTLTFHIQQDENDTFGTAVWKSKPTISSRLTAVFNPAADGSGTLSIKSDAAFPASGTAYLGTRAISYSAKSGAGALTVPAGGAATYSPFSADGSSVYARPQKLAAGYNWDVGAPPRVSNVPPSWIGKKVALYIHRILGGVWDTRAQAHLEFAGTIAGLQDGEGITVVTCHDLRKQIEDAQLLRKQFVGYVKPGVRVRAGEYLYATAIVTGGTKLVTDRFTIVSGSAGTDELTEGIYETADLVRRLNAWLTADTAGGGAWTLQMANLSAGVRTVVRVRFPSDASRAVRLHSNSLPLLRALGFLDSKDASNDEFIAIGRIEYDAEHTLVSTAPPYRIQAASENISTSSRSYMIEFESTEGSFFNGAAFYPTFLNEASNGEANWSYFKVGEHIICGKWDGTSKITNVSVWSDYGSALRTGTKHANGRINEAGITYDEPAEQLAVYQVVAMTGKFSTIIPTLFASIGGTSGVNHATYDVLPWGAAVPWSLLGTNFTNSCKALETAGKSDTISVLLEKPTSLKDVLIPEMALRFAFLIFKDGGYRFVSPTLPNAVTADHSLDETNKAVGPGEQVPMTTTEWTADYLVNNIKIQFGRSGDEFAEKREIVEEVSVTAHGLSEPLTIDAVNTVAADGGVSGSQVEVLASELATKVFPMFGKPVKRLERTLAPTLYHACPGDTAAVDDDMVRDPTTGTRGITDRACILLSTTHDYGHEGGRLMGYATLLMTDEDRTYPLAQASEVDTTYTSGLYTNGYDSTNFRLKLKSHAFSKSSAQTDVNQWNASDAVRVLELDPADPAAPDAWSKTLTSVSNADEYIQLNSALSAPAWGGATKKYVVIPQAYTSCQATQKLRAFQADDADGLVQDVAEPNLFGSQAVLEFSAGTATDLPALIPTETYGDGKPLTPYQLQYLARMANNLVSYKTAPHLPFDTYASLGTTSTSYVSILVFPFFIGGGQVAGRRRRLSVAPTLLSTTGATVYMRVTSSRFPPAGTTTTNTEWRIPYDSVEFTSTTTAWASALRSAQDLEAVPAQIPGFTWITVEMKATSPADARTVGLHTLYLKPVV